jgi:serine/threonine protein kinase
MDFIIRHKSTENSTILESHFRTKSETERDEWVSQIWAVTGYKGIEPSSDETYKYECEDRLGRGSFGVVYKARSLTDSSEVAVKCINCQYVLSKQIPLRVIERELQSLISMRHPNIVNLHRHFLEGQVIHLVMDYYEGGNLEDRIKILGKYPVSDARVVAFELIDALAYCHSKGIVHRDIKPANILLKTLNSNTGIVLIDFGLSKLVYEESLENSACIHTPVGTRKYAAPEVFDKAIAGYSDNTFPQKIDIWSAGAVVYTMLQGQPIVKKMSSNIMSQSEIHNLLSYIDQPAQSFLQMALNCDSLERPVATELLRHSWVSSLSINFRKQSEKCSINEFDDGWKGHRPPKTPSILERAVL